MSDPVDAPSSSQAATKRRAGEDDSISAPDNKKMAVEKKPVEPEPRSRLESSSGIITILSKSISVPYSILDTLFITVDTSLMKSYFTSIHSDLVNVLYPGYDVDDTGLISADNFVLVCRYLTKARIDHVYSTVSGLRPTTRIAIPREFVVPKCLADVVNGIGLVKGQNGALLFLPTPEKDPTDATQKLSTLVSFDVLKQFAHLVTSCQRRGFINTGFISSVTLGQAWWMLSARKSENPATVASDSSNVIVMATFHEWTPADACICALVQRQNTGLEGGSDVVLKWSTDHIRSIPSLRTAFNINA